MRALARTALLIVCAVHAGCAPTPVRVVENRRGQVNGESFELLTDSKKRGEWNIRVRGNVMWVAHTRGAKTDELGALSLEPDEIEQIWKLVEELAFPESSPDDIAPGEAMVLYRHRVPGEATYTATLPRGRAVKSAELKALVVLLQNIIKERTGVKARL